MTDTPIPSKKKRAPRNPPVIDREREIVANMASHGMPVTDMAVILNRGEAYIRKNFDPQIKTALIGKKIEIMNTLHAHVVGRPAVYDKKKNLIRAEIVPDRACVIFSAKAICGLKERDVHEHTGKDGGPIKVDDALERFWALVDRVSDAQREEKAQATSH